MPRNRRVKILATLGPATATREAIEKLYEAGVDVFRINMSHSTHEGLTELHGIIRNIERKHNRPIGILCDLQGPKLRIGEMSGGRVFLSEGSGITFDLDDAPGTEKRIPLPHKPIFEGVETGHTLILDDGKLRLTVTATRKGKIDARVEVGGPLASRKGISLPDTLVPLGALTDKDRSDLECAAKLGIDWIGLSFVQRADDVAEARKLLHGRAATMAKIEKPSALAQLDEIIELSDSIMVARGDLGVELPVERVPGLQKKITRAARNAGKPVVIATQMLESMISSPVPTRAEVSDVATAVFEGADAIMLSAESAVGQYPVEAVRMMDKVACEVESDPAYDNIIHSVETEPEATGADAIAAAAHSVSDTLKLVAIICYTSTGSTGLRVARERPQQPIITLTPIPETARRLAAVWGLHCVLTEDARDLDNMVDKACKIAFEEGFAKPGDRVIVTAGVPLGTPGATNMVRVAFLAEDGTALH
ncbi:MAG: pyruvate kinase [Hyphomicrobiaceae bacterium]